MKRHNSYNEKYTINFLKLIVVKRQLLRYYNYFEKKSNSCMLEEKPNFNFFMKKHNS